MESPIKYFAELTDPRVERTREHLLQDILFIAIAAVLCGAETWNEIEDYGKAKQAWLKTFLRMRQRKYRIDDLQLYGLSSPGGGR